MNLNGNLKLDDIVCFSRSRFSFGCFIRYLYLVESCSFSKLLLEQKDLKQAKGKKILSNAV